MKPTRRNHPPGSRPRIARNRGAGAILLFRRMPGAGAPRDDVLVKFVASRERSHERCGESALSYLRKFRGELRGTSRQPTRYLSEGI
jgi:hypothetical protein